MMDTIRVIMFEECNFKCSYCCNEKTQFNSQFEHVSLDSIDWSLYKVACVSGGEPFFRKDILQYVLVRIPRDIPIYIYTNGILITKQDLQWLDLHIPNLKGFNIGVHGVNQPKFVIPEVEEFFPVRWQAQDKNREKLLSMYPGRITEKNAKFWKMDDCNRVNERWVLLTDFSGK